MAQSSLDSDTGEFRTAVYCGLTVSVPIPTPLKALVVVQGHAQCFGRLPLGHPDAFAPSMKTACAAISHHQGRFACDLLPLTAGGESESCADCHMGGIGILIRDDAIGLIHNDLRDHLGWLTGFFAKAGSRTFRSATW